MENTRTEELRRRHDAVKAKLMSAVAMLLVATILMSTSTYAWFILSTAPEVKGMSTTVGANGALEMALMNDLGLKEDGLTTESYQDALDGITSNVGDSSAITNVAASNQTWGNLVDLSDTSYNLGAVKLYPAAVNATGASGTGAFAASNVYLQTPQYGVDGRVANLNADTYAGENEGGVFVYDSTKYGVRAVGKYSQQDPTAAALLAAKEGYARAALKAQQAASDEALKEENAKGLTRLLVYNALVESENTSQLALKITAADIAAISGTLDGLQVVADHLEDALKYAVVAYDIKANGKDSTLTVDNVNLSDSSNTSVEQFAVFIAEYNALQSKITAQKTAADALTLDNFEDKATEDSDYAYAICLDALMDLQTMEIGQEGAMYTIQDVSEMTNIKGWASGLTADARIAVTGATSPLVMVANMVSDYASDEFTAMLDDEAQIQMKDAVINVYKSTGDSVEATAIGWGTIIAGYSYTAADGSSANAKPTISPSDTFGYVIDLAFRCSTDTTLQLSAAQSRVAGSTDAALQGGGSTFVVETKNVAEKDLQTLVSAFRAVFFDPSTLKIYGVAGLEATDTANEYDLRMFNYAIDSTKSGNPLVLAGYQGMTYDTATSSWTGTANSNIMNLTADTATGLSVLVYLDGNYTDSTLDTIEGKLNLQFSSSATLTPMSYTGYVNGTGSSTTTEKTKY